MSEYERKQVLCLGSAILTGKKKGIGFVVLDDAGNETDNRMYFGKKARVHGGSGCVYEVLISEDGFRGNLKYIGPFKSEDRCAVLRLQSDGIDIEHQARLDQKKAEKSDDALREVLAPLSKLYRRTNALGKTALIARIITIIQRGY